MTPNPSNRRMSAAAPRPPAPRGDARLQADGRDRRRRREARHAHEDDIVKLDGNENPYGPSPKVAEALRDYGFYHLYPDPEQRRVREAVADYVGADVSQIVLGNGSDDLLNICAMLFLSPGDTHGERAAHVRRLLVPRPRLRRQHRSRSSGTKTSASTFRASNARWTTARSCSTSPHPTTRPGTPSRATSSNASSPTTR